MYSRDGYILMRWIQLLLTTMLFLGHADLQAGEVEVLHWWTSGGEAKSVLLLKQLLEKEGHKWKDFAVAGGGGESAMTVLKTRAISGNPPAAAQMKGLTINEWAKLGFLANLNPVAQAENWSSLIPPQVAAHMQYKNKYVAVPVNVHRVNWLWVNHKIFKQHRLSVPKTMKEFFEVAEKLKSKGIIPLAHGGQPWQDATLFESVALEALGPKQYKKAFVEHDKRALNSSAMIRALTNLRKMKQYIDKNAPGRDWNQATHMVIEGKAAMQIMGDWAKGEWTSAHKVAGHDYLCVASPGTQNLFSYNIDSFAFFKLKDKNNTQAQHQLAKTILTPNFQLIFNKAKGSIPVRTDLDISDWDACAKSSMKTYIEGINLNKVVPSWSHGMATTGQVQGAIYDIITNFFNDDRVSIENTVRRLAKEVSAGSRTR